MKIAVVGAGIHGLCTAKSLATRGHDVTVFEQHRSGNPFGSSHGRTRIVRQAYPDQFYTEILLKGHELWYKLEAETATKLIHEVGLLFVAQKDEPELWHELEALENLKISHKVLTQKDIRQVHSHMIFQEDEVAVMTLSAGWADVPSILAALQQRGSALGARFVQERILNLEELTERRGFDRVILTAGAWVTKFCDLNVKTTLQTFGYVDVAMQGPVWIEGFGDHMYGFPSETNSRASKIGFHTAGPETDPDTPDRIPQENAMEAIKACSRRRFGVEATIVESSACLYTTADNDDFRICWLNDQILMASPCSGHGFKFGPWMGEFLSDIIEQKDDLANWPRFQADFA